MASLWTSESAEIFSENFVSNRIYTNIRGEKSVPELFFLIVAPCIMIFTQFIHKQTHFY